MIDFKKKRKIGDLWSICKKGKDWWLIIDFQKMKIHAYDWFSKKLISYPWFIFKKINIPTHDPPFKKWNSILMIDFQKMKIHPYDQFSKNEMDWWLMIDFQKMKCHTYDWFPKKWNSILMIYFQKYWSTYDRFQKIKDPCLLYIFKIDNWKSIKNMVLQPFGK